ncbi:MAG: hypothetical protein CM1200mP12_14210 [Gammaproteobacteria bacterium]|nr:MAG: hypothetical protein CM1200mP12_14210 [Gammaproteobacteria bacterium]
MQVKDKRVVVTGAASGIGKALSVAFHNAGAQSVVAVDMNIDGAEETAKDVNGIAVEANVGQEPDIIRVIEKANELSGGIDIFCSNAGIGGVPGFLNVKNEDWQIYGKSMFCHIYLLQEMFSLKCLIEERVI